MGRRRSRIRSKNRSKNRRNQIHLGRGGVTKDPVNAVPAEILQKVILINHKTNSESVRGGLIAVVLRKCSVLSIACTLLLTKCP